MRARSSEGRIAAATASGSCSLVRAVALRVPNPLVTVRANRLLLMFWLIWFSEYRLREDSPALSADSDSLRSGLLDG